MIFHRMVQNYKFYLFFISVIFYFPLLSKENKSGIEKYENLEKKVCCKIKYKAGGFDYFVTSLKLCKSDLRYVSYKFLGSSLCLEWKK